MHMHHYQRRHATIKSTSRRTLASDITNGEQLLSSDKTRQASEELDGGASAAPRDDQPMRGRPAGPYEEHARRGGEGDAQEVAVARGVQREERRAGPKRDVVRAG